MPEDKSILKTKQNQGESYLDDLAFVVCVNGESLEKYKRIVEKKYGTDVYSNMVQFAQTLQQQVSRRQFTNTSLLSLKHLGKNAGMSEDAIEMIIDHFNSKVKEEQRIHEEDECWNNCPKNNRDALLGYLRKYPKGRYVKDAHANLRIIEKEENAKREEMAFWKQVNQNDKHQLKTYLIKYPTGKYVERAKSKIDVLERIEKDAIGESRMFNQCRTQRDYMDYLSKYPNGAYATKAKAIIEDLGRREIEENRVYNLCKDKKDYLDYLKKYPYGRYVKDAQAKIKTFENADRQREEDVSFWNQCTPRTKQNLQKYLNKYPNGRYAVQARSKIAEIERIEREAIEDSRMFNQCRTLVDYKDYVRKYPTGQYVKKANEKIKELDSASRWERDIHISELEFYKQCKTKDDFLRYLSLYPDGMYVYPAHNKIAHLEKIESVKRQLTRTDDENKEKKESEKESIKDKVPDEVQEKLKKLSSIANYSFIIAALAFAFLPNAFRWNHWAYLEMEQFDDAPTLWLFWLPIAVSILCFFTIPIKERLSSCQKIRDDYESGWTGTVLFNVIPCMVLLVWMFIEGQKISILMGIYLEDIHMLFMGPVICGIAWLVGLYSEYKMHRIAVKLGENQTK